MLSIIPSIFLPIVCIILISSTNAVDVPGNFTLPKHSQDLCFAARFDLTLNIEYLKTDGKTNISRIPLNNETYHNYDGKCLPFGVHSFTLTMLDNFTTISFEFSLNEKNETSLSKVIATININNNDYFPNCANGIIGPHVFIANESLFNADRSNSYRCNTKTKIDNFQNNRNVTLKSIDLQNLRIQPYIDSTTVFHDYGVEKVCAMDIFKNPNFIPIIVGVCLGVLIIVVLVVYLIRRRRSRNGYQSV